MQKKAINDLTGLKNCVKTLDKASYTDLFYGNQSFPQKTDNYRGIYNLGTGTLASVVSPSYQIVQHQDCFNAIHNALDTLGLNVFGVMKNNNNNVICDLVFSNADKTLVKDDATGIMLGIRIVNSYDKSTSFRLEMYGYRKICQNGMAFGNVMGVREITFHTGKDKPIEVIEEITQKFVKNVLDSSSILQQYVSESMKDTLEWNLVLSILPKLLNKKYSKAIIQRLEASPAVNRWTLYNAITAECTHNKSLGHSVTAWLERKSQFVLSSDFKSIVNKVKTIEVEVD